MQSEQINAHVLYGLRFLIFEFTACQIGDSLSNWLKAFIFPVVTKEQKMLKMKRRGGEITSPMSQSIKAGLVNNTILGTVLPRIEKKRIEQVN